MSSSIRFIEEPYMDKDTAGERVLFLSVILQALLDATKPEYNGEPDTATLDRDQATAWFFAKVGVTAKDFETVCELAGVDAPYTRDFAYKVLKSGEITFIRKRINTLLTHS